MPVSDSYKMPYGKHKGEKIGVVPAGYLDWLAGQKWVGHYMEIRNYIVEDRDFIDQELEDRDSVRESQW